MNTNFSQQNRTDEEPIRHSESIHILRTLLLVLITAAIIFSNLINIWILRKVRELQTLAKVLLINLSIAGFINGLFVCFPAILASVYNRWPLSNTYCTVSCILHGITCTVSIWCLAIVSLDRYIAINFPVRYRNAKKLYYLIVILLAVWFLSLITFLSPQLVDSNYYRYQESIAMCGMLWKSVIFCIVTGLYIPILSAFIIFYSSYKVSKALSAILQAKINRRGQVKCSQDLKAIRMLKMSTVCYIAAWGPYTLIAYLKAFDVFSNVPDEIEFIVAWLANCNSIVNVIIYSGNLDGFLRQLKKTFSCCVCSHCCRDNSVYPGIHEDSNLPSTITKTNIY